MNQFWGHMVSHEGINVDPMGIKADMKCEPLKTRTKINVNLSYGKCFEK